jgi:glycosyltransferase involved in cell wall biosynthesis
MLETIIGRAKALGIRQHLEFLGRVPWSDMPRVYARADIGVFPSYSEMLPNALLEMMSTGLPVVAYAVGAIPEVIRDGESGYVLPAGDKTLLAERLCHLIDHPHVAHSMGYAATETVKREFSMAAVAERTRTFYKRCLPTIIREPS